MGLMTTVALVSLLNQSTVDYLELKPLKLVDSTLRNQTVLEVVEAIGSMKGEEIKVEEELEEVLEEGVLKDVAPHYNPNNLFEVSHLTMDDYYTVLRGTEMYSLGWVFHHIEDVYHINGLFFVGLVALESGWNTSYHATVNNNLTGYNIIDETSSFSFATPQDSIFATAKLIYQDYLNPQGRYHNGVSIESVNLNYCANSDWAEKINQIVYQLLNQLEK